LHGILCLEIVVPYVVRLTLVTGFWDLQNEGKLREALRFANACGAITTTERGAIPSLPDMDTVMQFISKVPAWEDHSLVIYFCQVNSLWSQWSKFQVISIWEIFHDLSYGSPWTISETISNSITSFPNLIMSLLFPTHQHRYEKAN
jgi:hypothetical protein